MKKLQLKLDGVKEMLTREQMKKITGGSGGRYKCCYTEPGKSTACSACITFGPSASPICGSNGTVQGVLTAC